MKHFMLKFNHGVEIGAELAYQGHFMATKDLAVYDIMLDEIAHQYCLETILEDHDESPSLLIDFVFTLIGYTIGFLCRISPKFLLNYIAKTMETFAVFSYSRLALKYPAYADDFAYMIEKEKEHEAYFKGLNDDAQ